MAQLSEVARTGRKFRRKSNPETWFLLQGQLILTSSSPEEPLKATSFNAEQIVASDWEAEPQKIEITAQELFAIAKELSNHPICNSRRLSPVEFMKLVVEQLGLED